MQSRRARWLGGPGVLVLVGSMLVVGVGTGITLADDNDKSKNPFTQILKKLDEILTKLNDGGGGQDGNHTLRWDQALSAAQRFVILPAFNNEAVLDKNTGLVWEKSPATSRMTLGNARFECVNKNVGGQNGWRLPAIAELGSLIDPSLPPPFVPAGVFTGVQSAVYWSASTVADNPISAWFVNFNIGTVNAELKLNSNHMWCVRGPMHESVY